MLDALLKASALPNLHPALVHFPIALAAVGLLFDAVHFARRSWVSLDAGGALLWVLATAGGGAALVTLHRDEEKLLDEADWRLPAGEVTVALSVSGRHWKGFVDGRGLVHGHASLPAAGRIVLLLDGTGTLRLVSVRIAPL